MTARTLTTIGLVLDIVGVVWLAYYAFPPKIGPHNAPQLYVSTPSDADIAKNWHEYKMSWIAIGLIVVGFVFQLIATWLR